MAETSPPESPNNPNGETTVSPTPSVSPSPSPPFLGSPPSVSPTSQTTASTVTTISSATSSSPNSTTPQQGTTKPPTGKTTPATNEQAPQHPPDERVDLKYSIASHSVRISKLGYAIEPVELGYPEIIRNLSNSSRHSSDYSFDSRQIGHKILSLIRGFWSQPAFPNGKQVRFSENHSSIRTILNEFKRHPPHPHKGTYGHASTEISRSDKAKSPKSPTDNQQMTAEERNNQRARQISLLLSQPSSSNSQEETTNDEILTKNIRDKFEPFPDSPPSSSGAAGGGSNKSSPGAIHKMLRIKKKSPTSKDLSDKSIFALFARATSGPAVSKSKKKRSPSPVESPPAPPPPQNAYYSWIPKNKDSICELVNQLCRKMELVFSREPRILQIGAPCLILGDIHGNLSDVRDYERSLWPRAPNCVSNNYLFLGDYVDRGDYSIECVLYLFSLKLIAPHRFFLLRGNHEVAAIQKQYTFGRECEIKFGQAGKQIWRNFNKVFDLMPVAAIVDKQIFCAHGGIPKSITELSKLAKEIPSPLDNPEVQCPSAWEILWNDPITDTELVGMIEMDNAVVTQSQTTQTQPGPNGTDMVTETTASTTISSEQPAVANKQDEPNADKRAAALNDVNAFLSREPPGALSFYIKPADDGPNTQQPNSANQRESDAMKGANKQPATTNSTATNKKPVESDVDNSDNEETGTKLRTVPSDTSSIASSSPQQIINDGFIANIKRGTAYLFSDQAINNFLKVNKLSHIIRAHEVIPTGFAFHGDGRVITIFSSSKYCGLNNQPACALVDDNRIRIFRLDTGEAGE